MLRQQVGVLSHAIAGTLDLDDYSMVKEAVQQGGRHYRIAKDLAPFGKAAVGCKDHGNLFVSGVEELEEQVAAARRDREISDLVDDEQGGAAQEANPFAQRALAFSLGQRSDQIGKRDEVDALACLHGFDCGGGRDVAFPGARRSQQMHDLGPVDEVEAGQRQDPVAVERWLEGEVISVQRLDDRQPGHAQGRLDPAVLPQRQFFVQQNVDRLNAIDLALLDPAQGGVEHFQGARHFEMDQTAADIINARRGTPMAHGCSPRASWLPIV